MITSMQRLRRGIGGYFKGYGVLVEMGLRKRLLRGLSNIARLLEQHTTGDRNVPIALAELGKRMEGTLELVRKMKPDRVQEPLVPDDDEDGD